MALPDVTAGATGHVSHHNSLHDWTQFDRAVRYVETSANGGSDSNDGRTPMQPKLTIQSAYDSLPTATGNNPAGGVILAGAGRFDVGTGLVFDRDKPVHIIGMNPRRAWSTSVWATWGAQGTVLTRTAASYPTLADPFYTANRSIISFGTATATGVGGGFTFENLIFELLAPTNAGITAGINCYAINHMVVLNCAFFGKHDSAVAVYQEAESSTIDASWGKVERCYMAGCAAIRTRDTTVPNDGWRIIDNIIWSPTNPAIDGIFANPPTRWVIENNDIGWAKGTGTTWGIHLKSAFSCRVEGNAAENTNNFCLIENGANGASHDNVIIQGGRVTSQGTGDVYLRFDGTTTGNNFAILQTLGAWPSGSTPYVDNTTNKKNYVLGIASPDSNIKPLLWLPTIKRGSGTPLNVVAGSIGDIYQRTDGGAATSFYVKESGADNTSTGWVAK